ncbi:DUF930 domain-containing protein [Roseibium sp.]|uniref:DUF930 domain-containing protein n=1 Tax=Roseibium sp. TaxID=1936156 RepID=UPI003A979555
MKRASGIGLAVSFAVILPSGGILAAHASSGMELITPQQQLEQRCDVEAMTRLNADKVIAYTFEDPVYSDHSVTAPGAAFRRKQKWFRLSYNCSTDPGHQKVVKFELEVGKQVPRSSWDQYYLYP